ncbi:MAG: ABC transporter substrate-binding protein [Paracoccaceae bacterium]
MTIDRRRMLSLIVAAGAALTAGAPPAAAIAPEEAERFVANIADELTELVQSELSPREQAERFREIFVRDAALEQIQRFVMGVAWRDMSDEQKSRFREAFLDYVANTYTDLLLDYEGQTLDVRDSSDFGDKGVLVFAKVSGDGPVSEWLVSDRGGDGPKLVDITAEGVSLLRSQRQEFAAMLEKRNGDIDRFISDLAESSGAPQASSSG